MIISEEYYRDWYIKGIAESVVKEINDDGEELDDVLDDYLQRTYWTIYSRVPDDARIVVELVKQHIRELDAQL
jgi:hypothetical protein